VFLAETLSAAIREANATGLQQEKLKLESMKQEKEKIEREKLERERIKREQMQRDQMQKEQLEKERLAKASKDKDMSSSGGQKGSAVPRYVFFVFVDN